MRRSLLTFFFLLCCFSALAGEKGERRALRWGADWGYGLDIYHYWNINYLDTQVGYRVWDQDYEWQARPNAYACLKLGYEVLPWMEVSVFSGIMGISEGRKIIPAGLQIGIAPGGNANAGPVFNISGGAGFKSGGYSPVPAAFAMMGGGWRFRINSVWDMDLLLRTRLCKDSPPVWDKDDGIYITEENVRRNVALTASLEFGIALSF